MKQLYDELSLKVSKQTTNQYSTSFSLGILALKPRIRPAIYAIYGFVRLADEIVDSFDGYEQRTLLARLRDQLNEALEEKISINPILNAFQQVVNDYQISFELIDCFLRSMEMDLEDLVYDSDKYNEYILGSAEVVGLMCLQVFVEGDKLEYDRLKPYAMKLGAAFQKVNFLRDLKDDFEVLGRTYFPSVDMAKFDDAVKLQIEQEIEKDFEEALKGIKMLPTSARFGVYLAYRYYLTLFAKIKRTPAKTVAQQRIRIPNPQKLSIMMSSYFAYKVAL